MSNDRVDTNRPEYSWIPFFEELALRLHENGWRHRQPEIVRELKRMKAEGMRIAPWVDNLTEWIDPFSLIGTIRRVGFDNAIPIMESFKTFFGVDVGIPVEDPITPTMQPQSSFFFTGIGDDGQTEIHWDLFTHIMSIDDLGDKFELADLLNKSAAVYNVGAANLSGALFWIKPHVFLKTDTIHHFLHTWDYSDFGRKYLENLIRVRYIDSRPFPVLNADAWLTGQFADVPESRVKMWQVRGGANFIKVDDFLAGGYVGVGFGIDAVDCSLRWERTDLDDACHRANPGIGPGGVKEVWDFAKEIKRGELIVMPITRNGDDVRYGFALSDGTYHVESADWPRNRRSILWRDSVIDGRDLDLPQATVSYLWGARDALVGRIRRAEGVTDGLDNPVSDVVPTIEKPREKPSREPYTVDTMLSEGVFLDEPELTRIMAQLERKQNLILQGPPGTGKTFLAKRLAYALMGDRTDERVSSVQFHQSYAYEDFVGGYRPDVNEQEQLVFKPRDGAFLRLCHEAREMPDAKFVMLIDEINRGNLSRVFGELLMLIEADKRSPTHAVELQHRISDVGDGDGKFFVPPNVYIIGTMNLADRSLTGMNVAMRRRFAFAELRPRFDSQRFATEVTKSGMSDEMLERIRTRMDALNATISEDASLGRQYEVGHSFFCPDSDGPPGADWEAWYEAVVEFEIRPLLEEYWFDDARKAADEVAKLLAAS